MNFVKKLRLFDYLIIFIILATFIVGFLTFNSKRATSANQIEATVPIELEIYLRGVATTDTDALFKKDDETFITIRNVPYTKLKIKDVKYNKKKIMLPVVSSAKKPYILVDDMTAPYQYDYLVRILDTAKITKDGAVVGGNKIKMGLPVTLEGQRYKFNGTISDVRVTSDVEVKDDGENTNIG